MNEEQLQKIEAVLAQHSRDGRKSWGSTYCICGKVDHATDVSDSLQKQTLSARRWRRHVAEKIEEALDGTNK